MRPLRVGLLTVTAVLVGCLPALAAESTGRDGAPAAQPLNQLTPAERQRVKQAETRRIEAISRAYPTVVCVFGKDRSGGGSGVLIDPVGLALTNHHVVAAAGSAGVAGLADGKLYPWRLIGTDPGGDIALIQLQHSAALPFAPLGDSDRVQVGDWAMAMGNPFVLAEDYRSTVTLGIVSGVERFQPGGGGKNQLIYGNCIQVDSSISPGNSGGPLFDMNSQVIGINGRGSFKERGRVNVGLGYAVSIRQIRNFIPELLATKIAQHGTLDAIFSNRGGRVVCSTIDLDAATARAGLMLGDEMVSFEGRSIADANQFMNLITTLPAGWPVRLRCRRGGKEFSLSLRLSPLPYTLSREEANEEQPRPPQPVPDASPTAAAQKSSPVQAPPRIEKPAAFNLADAGKIRDPADNQGHAARLLHRWRATLGAKPLAAGVQAIRFEAEWRNGNRVSAHQQLILAADSRFRGNVRKVSADGKEAMEHFGYDGERFWRRLPGKRVEDLPLRDAIELVPILQAIVLRGAMDSKFLARLGTLTIDGSDRVDDRLAYRLRLSSGDGAVLYFWLSLEVDGDLTRHALLAVGNAMDPSRNSCQVLFKGAANEAGTLLPVAAIIRGGVAAEIFVTDRATMTSLETDTFARPIDVDH